MSLQIRITSPDEDAVNFTSTYREAFDEEIEDFVDAFNAFTPAGKVFCSRSS